MSRPKTFHERHVELIQAINNSTTRQEHRENEIRLEGWLDGLKWAGYSDADIGRVIMDGDLYIAANFGDERPICGGVYLDWKPESSTP